MKNTPKLLLAIAIMLSASLSLFSQDQCSPIGWATQNGGTTGGGSATPTVVSNYNDLKSAITSSSVKVVHISGVITIPSGGRISFQDQTGKTIFGLPGSRLVSNDLTKDNSGIIYVKRCTNIIIRNVTFEGPGAYDTDGWDNITIDNSTNIWVDHCEFQDGMDGNLDIKNAADFISVTWCKFIYNKAPIPGGPGGSDDHRFSNLFGSSDGATGDRGHLRITMQNNWWAQGCKERMPRVRFGKVHVVNNLFNSTVANKCTMAGFEADLLVESNVFENVNSPIDKMNNDFTAITSRNNIFTNTTGNTTGSGTAFTPPYSLTITPAANVKSQVMAGAGAIMTGPGSCGGTTTYSLTTSFAPLAGGTVSGAGTYNSGTVVTVTATPALGYAFTSWGGDASGTNTSTTVTMNSNKTVTANFSAVSNQLSIAFNTTATSSQLNLPYISGVISDPTDPATTKGIVVDVKYNGAAIPSGNYSISSSSSNTGVVSNSNIVASKSNGQATIRITPTGVGYTTITVTLIQGPNTKALTINYAASGASSNPAQTIWPTGISDASAAIALDDNYAVIGDDELNNLYVHSRLESGLAVKSYNYAGNLNLPDGTNEEVDLEAGVRSPVNGTRVYWIGSMGNGKEPDFKDKPNRNRIFATNISGTGSATTFSPAGYYGTLKEKIIAWGDNNGYNFSASAAVGHDAKVIDGFNVEGMTFGPDNTTLYVGMRAPLVPTGNRTKAVIAPILNFETWFNNGSPSGNPAFGSPIELNLGGRGIRDLVHLSNGIYIIVAGSSDNTQISALYKWTGSAADAPVLLNSFNTSGLNLEALMGVNESGVLSQTKLQAISDNGSEEFYNDGIEAKDLSQNNFKKYRADVLTGDISSGGSTYSLSATTNPAAGGSVSGAGTYNSGTVVTLTASPAGGYTFTGWSGDASGTSATTTVTMSSNKSVTANFQLIPPATYILTTAANPAAGGSVSGAGTYNSGTVVTVTATPATGYTFTGWSGDASGTNATATITMNSNKNATANFQVSGTGGTNTIRIEDNATATTGLCSYDGAIGNNSAANNGKVINLSNALAKGVTWNVYAGSTGTFTLLWRYVNSSSSNSYAINLIINGTVVNTNLPFPKTANSSTFSTTSTTVNLVAGNNTIRLETIESKATADFDWIEITGTGVAPGDCNSGNPPPPVTYSLTTSASPSSGGAVSGAGTYNSGTVITITATPATGFTFTGWSGDASGTSSSINVTMDGNKNIVANFAPVTYTLSVSASPSVGGSVSGAGTYNSGTVVTVTATPSTGYTFTGWSGDASGSATSVSLTMTANKNIVANFTPITYTLTAAASPTAGGSVSGAGTYNSGTVVTVTATPAAGYNFTGWSGDASGTNATTTVTMSSNKSVTANFQLIPPATYTLTTAANPAAGGFVSGAGTYNSGTVVTVTATPAAGYTFTGWSGDASGTNTTTTVAMSGNKSVTASFQASGGGTSTIRIEDNATASTGLCLYEGSISSNSGANNGKVINLTNSTGKGVNWKVNVPAAGSYSLNWRYVNSSTSNTYSMKLIVNGITINAALPFPKTSGSSVFSNTIVAVNLATGNNDIRLESVTSNATADIDWIEITGNSPAPGNCAAARRSNAQENITSANSMQKSNVYPNPAKGKVNIGFYLPAADNVSIKIVRVNGIVAADLGRKLYAGGDHLVTYDLSGKTTGLYAIVITGDREIKKVIKLIVQ